MLERPCPTRSQCTATGAAATREKSTRQCRPSTAIRSHFSKIKVTFIKVTFRRRQWHPTPVLFAWKIPWMEEPGRLQSMGSRRVGHDSVTSLSLFTFMHWRRKWQPTPVFLPGESHGQRSLAGHGPWGRRELDMTEVTKHAHSIYTYYKKLAVFPVLYNIYL